MQWPATAQRLRRNRRRELTIGRMTKRNRAISRRKLLQAATAAAGILFTRGSRSSAVGGSAIASISAKADQLHITLHATGNHRLFSFPLYTDLTTPAAGTQAWEGDLRGETKLSIPRTLGAIDRLYHRFQLVDAATGKPVGTPRFADDLRELPSSPPSLPWPASIKGVSCPVDVKDLAELGVRHTHINVSANAIVSVDEAHRDEAFSRLVDGQRAWFNPNQIRALDRTIRELTDAKINAVGVVINYVHTPGVLTHPRTDVQRAPNHMGAFNLTNAQGLRHFRGLIEFLSDRYCRGNPNQGSVGGWIIGNEVQSTWEWHNMGPASTADVARQYADELRTAHFAVRSAGAAVPVFASFDHFWHLAYTPDAMRHRPGRLLLDALASLTQQEGPFPWHVAQHPYPENLFNPAFWNDKTAAFAYDSPRITFKNVEVLSAYLRRPEMLHEGKPRRLIFSEQGLHAGDTAPSEQIQAAAYALAYRRLLQVPGVEAFILHRHVDAAEEGGLKLGIWPLSGIGPGKRKRPIWEVVKTIDTPQWETTCAFALPILGLANWSAVQAQHGPFPEHAPDR